MKIVLDTNIFIAAALNNGFSRDILELLGRSTELTTITSEDILAELQDKLQNKFHWLKTDINLFLVRINNLVVIVKPTQKIDLIKRDLDDNKILECAVEANADLIVTLDQDLINLKKFKKTAIIHPKTFSWMFPEYFKKV